MVQKAALNDVVLQAVKDRIVHGFERVEPHLNDAIPAEIDESALQRAQYSSSSLWFCNRLDRILPTIFSLLHSRNDLRRLTIYVLDPASVAAAAVHPKYRLIFRHPLLKIVVPDANRPLDSMLCRDLFAMRQVDREEKTDFLFYFDEDFPNREEWKKQFIGIHSFISMAGRRVDDFEFATKDQIIGFENTLGNIPVMFRNPDLRKVVKLFQKKPAVVLGAGPSVGPQLDWIKEHRDEFLLIAADTMLVPLRKSGIEADVISSIERVPDVLELLDPENAHPESLLVGSSVLLPECYKNFQGPVSPYMAMNAYEEWLPFKRSTLSTGNSCVGLGIVLAGMFHCDPILLMGVDLCWAPGGESHTAEVPYLSKETYKKNNSLRYEESFSATNFNGEEVRTNHYWVMFQSQFNNWMSYIHGKVYNLSSFGLPLRGAQNIDLSQVPDFEKLEKPASKQLREALPYLDQTKQRLLDLGELSSKSKVAAAEVRGLKQNLGKLATQQYSEQLEHNPLYPTVLKCLIQYALQATESKDSKIADQARSLIDSGLERIEAAFSKCSIDSEELRKKAIQEKWTLF